MRHLPLLPNILKKGEAAPQNKKVITANTKSSTPIRKNLSNTLDKGIEITKQKQQQSACYPHLLHILHLPHMQTTFVFVFHFPSPNEHSQLTMENSVFYSLQEI
jgi:hypothetical protein